MNTRRWRNFLIPPILMKHKLILCLVCCLLLTRTAHAQWIVTDPVNLAGNIANTIKEIATASNYSPQKQKPRCQSK